MSERWTTNCCFLPSSTIIIVTASYGIGARFRLSIECRLWSLEHWDCVPLEAGLSRTRGGTVIDGRAEKHSKGMVSRGRYWRVSGEVESGIGRMSRGGVRSPVDIWGWSILSVDLLDVQTVRKEHMHRGTFKMKMGWTRFKYLWKICGCLPHIDIGSPCGVNEVRALLIKTSLASETKY